jgi:hypothetical protein
MKGQELLTPWYGLITIILIIALFWGGNPISTCEGDLRGTDLYEYEDYGRCSNWSGSFCIPECKVGNHTLDAINKKAREEATAKEQKEQEERKACYDAGKDYNLTFDLIEDYNLSCAKIQYLNDHFLLSAEQKDGGYIDGSSYGLFSSGHIEGKFYDWVNTEVVATGKLVKEMKFHLDCKNSTMFWRSVLRCSDGKIFPDEINYCENGVDATNTTKIIYYTEADFVVYYTDRCIR